MNTLVQRLRQLKLTQLAWCVGLSVLITLSLSVLITYHAAQEEVQDLLDDDLEQQTELLADVITKANMNREQIHQLLSGESEAADSDELWITVRSQQAPWQVSNRNTNAPFTQEGTQVGTHFIEYQGSQHGWRGYQFVTDDWIIQMMRRDDLTDDLQEEIIESITAPTLITGAITLTLLLALVWVTVRPLSLLSKQISTRKADDLSPIRVQGYTQEINTLINSINQQMQAVESVLTRERQFANDIAHELRTPLSTLKLELSLPEPDISVLKAESQRITRMVEQLLTLARLEQHHWHTQMAPVDLADLATALAERFGPKCDARSIQLVTHITSTCVQGNRTLLEMLITNLINNALEHSQSATEIELSVSHHQITVKDNGAGLSPDKQYALNHVIEAPVKRLDSQGDGLGIGLTICQRIARLHSARLHFDDAKPGLCVTLTF